MQAIHGQPATIMTKDLLRQKVISSNCVTPNVPRLRGSFFNRKYRESGGSAGQSTPSTPKVVSNKSGSGSRTRQRKSATKDGTPSFALSSGKDAHRPNRSRPNSNEFFEPDFSTPRATRASMLTPTTGVTTNKDGRIAHFYYRPLELDNDSSSESTDNIMRRRHANSQNKSQEKEPPLAIEADHAEVTLTILPSENRTEPVEGTEAGKSGSQGSSKKKSPPKEIELIVIDSDDSQEPTEDVKKVNSLSQKRSLNSTQSDAVECSQVKKSAKMVQSSQCITPPTTPPDNKVRESVSTKKFSTFVPGNCNIEEVLKIYGQESHLDTVENQAE